jgi:hypothetical protein
LTFFQSIEDHPVIPKHEMTMDSEQSDDHPVAPEVGEGQVNFRDSVLTQQSFSSSSIYPLTTSTASGTASVLPLSAVDPEPRCDVHSYEPDIDEVEDSDGDDVSFRLRLLVNNKYFLPPSDFAYSPTSLSKMPFRPAAHTFLDIFRVGKSKSKPPTPRTPPEGFTSALRTTSDSNTVSGYTPHPHSRSLTTTPLMQTRSGLSQDRTGRVVVVREKMSDLVTAAKQSELEMKMRERTSSVPDQTHLTCSDHGHPPANIVNGDHPPEGYLHSIRF